MKFNRKKICVVYINLSLDKNKIVMKYSNIIGISYDKPHIKFSVIRYQNLILY